MRNKAKDEEDKDTEDDKMKITVSNRSMKPVDAKIKRNHDSLILIIGKGLKSPALFCFACEKK